MHLIHNFDEMIERRGTDSKKFNPDVYPEDVLPMWIADTDFKCPAPIVEKMIQRAQHGLYGYPYNSKTFELAAKRWMKRRFHWDIDENWVEFTPGVIPGIIFAVRALSMPGDKIIIQTPVYPPFHQLVVNNGRRLETNSLVLRDGKYHIDFTDLEDKLKDSRTKILILCNPHNPTGRVFTKKELQEIGNLCLKHNVFVISDEIHCDIVYKGHEHIPFASISEEFAQNSMICINPSKTFNIAGFRTAAAIIPNEYKRKLIYESVVNNKAYGRTVFGALAFETAYTECEYYANQLAEYLQANMEFTSEYIKNNITRINLIEPEATYLLWLDFRKLQMSQDKLVEFMVNKAKVGLNDGETFGSEGIGFMRINIATQRQTLEKGLERIQKAINEL